MEVDKVAKKLEDNNTSKPTGKSKKTVDLEENEDEEKAITVEELDKMKESQIEAEKRKTFLLSQSHQKVSSFGAFK